MRKVILLLLVLLCAYSAVSVAEGASFIMDSAGVISQDTLSEATRIAEKIEKESGIRLHVELCHFLGGADTQASAVKRLSALEDSEDSLYLLAVVGEESYALAAGKGAEKKLNRDARDNLLSTQFRLPFLDRNYDLALAQLMLGIARQVAPDMGGKYFDHLTATKRPDSDVYRSITITSPDDEEEPAAQRDRDAKRDKGMSIFSIIAFGMVLSAIFGNKDKRRGCGCGPLGWIFSAFGLAKIFGWRK